MANNSLLTISKNESYDSLGRKINDSIIYNNSNVLSIEHNYNKTRIVSDIIQNNTRSYSYNGRNYISSITDSVYGSHNYTYDERGYLSADNNTTYTYDGNGNIISVGSLSFAYDNTYKDRLISVGGTPITYYSNNMYYPYTFNNKTFYYEGKRLKKVTISSNREIEFFYDDEGIRYKKIEKNNNVITKTVLFYYDNKQLIGEVVNGVKRSYLYDSYGNIYGYIIGNDSYYYIKDSLGIVHSVMNSSGTIIETYTYDAYGNIISTSGSSTNNIKYKGYYYDEEIEMYYLLSRYYYPYWRRFLTPDNYTYLDLENINDLNLFAYCNNNPVMYSDGSGHFPTWAKWVIGVGVIGLLAVATVATGGAASGTLLASIHSVASGALLGSTISSGIGMTAGGLKLDENGIGWNWDNAATGFMIGSISGAISGGVNASLGVAGLSNESYLTRGIMAGTDSLLGLGSYFAQNGINGTMENVSLIGALISFSGGLFDFTSPLNKYFDAFWSPALASEIGWGYDVIRNAIKKKRLGYSFG